MTSDLDIWHVGSSSSYLGQVWRSRSYESSWSQKETRAGMADRGAARAEKMV